METMRDSLPSAERAAALADFFAFARTVIDAGRLREEARFVQHGTCSTLLHSLAVALRADGLARAMGLRGARLDEVRRAALLHDYYLYDWHVPDPGHRLHAFTHPGVAARNALEDYPDLTCREVDAIERHMFPLTPVPPRWDVGWAVTLADKRCAAHETRVRRGAAYPGLAELCARHLPGVELGPTGPLGDAGARRGGGAPGLQPGGAA